MRETTEVRNYKHVKNVYTIIFFEHSTAEFHNFPNVYMHHFTQKSDTGLRLNLLQEYYFIPLDIFQKKIQNKGINSDLDAWLTFLTSDDPETIAKLLRAFPAFEEMYQDIYELCLNIEGVMHMFSKELQQLDRNTVEYMIDEMQNEINRKNAIIEENNALLGEKDALIEKMQLVNKLYSLLIADNHQEDLNRALTNEVFRDALLTDYDLV